jgi:hypothetical protein
MVLELNRATFHRLVQLHLIMLPLAIGAGLAELLNPQWLAFADEFDALAERHFGTGVFSERAPFWPLALLLAPVIWNFAAAIGLLWYKRWARFGSWASVVVLGLATLMFDGYRPDYMLPLTNWLQALDGMLFGALLLMAYADGYGSEWFGRSARLG